MSLYYEVKISAENQEQADAMMTFTLPDDINAELREWIDQTLA